MSENRPNIFISHIHEDDSEIAAMKDLLSKSGFEVRDSSVDSSKPNNATNSDYIKSQVLAPCIQWAGVLVVLISPGTRESEWVDWEIEYAQKHDKRIVGVWAHGANNCDVPQNLELYADAVVGWQGDRIKDAICGTLNNWETSTGEPRGPIEIRRYSCE